MTTTMVKPHLFIPGPTNIPDAVRMAMNIPMEDMRSPDYPKFTLPVFEDLKKVFKMKDGRVFIFPSSGTGAWESAITNTLAVGDKVLMSRFGQFSLLWVDMAERLGLNVELCDEEWGTGVPLEKYADILAKDTERTKSRPCSPRTTKPQRASPPTSRAFARLSMPPSIPRCCSSTAFRRSARSTCAWANGASTLASPARRRASCFRPASASWPSSQKALDANKSLNGRMNRCFFSWEDMIKTNDLGYFPYTPATQLIRGLRASLDLIFAEGLDNVIARHTRLATGVRAAVDAWGLKLCAKEAKWHSDTVSAILVPEGIDAVNVLKTAYYRYNTSLGTGLNKVAGKVFRIGHLGALDEGMIGGVLFNVEMALKDCGVPIKFGSGTGAAAEYFSKTATKPALQSAA